jgi:hypothetical protein
VEKDVGANLTDVRFCIVWVIEMCENEAKKSMTGHNKIL